MFYNKLTACNKAKGAGEWRRRRGGQQFLHRLPVLNHTTREWKRGERKGKGEKQVLILLKKNQQQTFTRYFFLYILTECVDEEKQS